MVSAACCTSLLKYFLVTRNRLRNTIPILGVSAACSSPSGNSSIGVPSLLGESPLAVEGVPPPRVLGDAPYCSMSLQSDSCCSPARSMSGTSLADDLWSLIS